MSLTDSATWNSVYVSLVYTFGTIVPAFGIGMLTALLLNRVFPFRRWLRSLILLPGLAHSGARTTVTVSFASCVSSVLPLRTAETRTLTFRAPELAMASAFPYQDEYRSAHALLAQAAA